MADLKLTDVELKVLGELHKKAQDLIFTLGQTDLRMDEMRAEIRALNHKAQSNMNEVARRLGIPAGTPWQALPDGTIVMLEAPPPTT